MTLTLAMSYTKQFINLSLPKSETNKVQYLVLPGRDVLEALPPREQYSLSPYSIQGNNSVNKDFYWHTTICKDEDYTQMEIGVTDLIPTSQSLEASRVES